jgi:hypothetical protein
MKCPKCGREMTQGVPHDDNAISQWECLCGYIQSIFGGDDDQ